MTGKKKTPTVTSRESTSLEGSMSSQSHTRTHAYCTRLHSSDHSSFLPLLLSLFLSPYSSEKKSPCEDDTRGRDCAFKVPSHRPCCAQAGAAGYPPSWALIGCSAPASRDEGLHHGTAIQHRPKRRGAGEKVQTSEPHETPVLICSAFSFLLNKFFWNGEEMCSGNTQEHVCTNWLRNS